MHDPRNSTALRQLADLGPDPDPPRWRWGIVRPDPEGRLRLPAEARRALRFRPGHRHHVRGICHRFALVARVDDAGASLVVDSRGRLTLPVWLRRGTDRALVVGSDAAATTVVVAPIAVLDRLGELLAGAPCGPDSAPSPGSRPALPTLPARRGGSTGASPSRGRSPTRTSPRRTRDRVQRRGRGQPAHRGGAPRAHRDRPAEQHRPVHPVRVGRCARHAVAEQRAHHGRRCRPPIRWCCAPLPRRRGAGRARRGLGRHGGRLARAHHARPVVPQPRGRQVARLDGGSRRLRPRLGEDLARGRTIAGTGSIAGNGSVGTIGGLRAKATAARRIGADNLLFPAEQVSQLHGFGPGTTLLVPVSTLDDAIEALSANPDLVAFHGPRPDRAGGALPIRQPRRSRSARCGTRAHPRPPAR